MPFLEEKRSYIGQQNEQSVCVCKRGKKQNRKTDTGIQCSAALLSSVPLSDHISFVFFACLKKSTEEQAYCSYRCSHGFYHGFVYDHEGHIAVILRQVYPTTNPSLPNAIWCVFTLHKLDFELLGTTDLGTHRCVNIPYCYVEHQKR